MNFAKDFATHIGILGLKIFPNIFFWQSLLKGAHYCTFKLIWFTWNSICCSGTAIAGILADNWKQHTFYRITAWKRWETTSRHHIVQQTCSELLRAISHQTFNIYMDGDSAVSLDNLFKWLNNLMAKKWFFMFKHSFLYASLCNICSAPCQSLSKARKAQGQLQHIQQSWACFSQGYQQQHFQHLSWNQHSL